MGAESKDPEDGLFFIAANAAYKIHAFSGSFDSSSSRQAGTRPSLRWQT